MGVDATAVSATPVASPEGALEPLCSRLLIGKHIQQLHNCDAFNGEDFLLVPGRFVVSFIMETVYRESIGVVKHYG